jgi:hypothetical protein
MSLSPGRGVGYPFTPLTPILTGRGALPDERFLVR